MPVHNRNANCTRKLTENVQKDKGPGAGGQQCRLHSTKALTQDSAPVKSMARRGKCQPLPSRPALGLAGSAALGG